MANEIKTTDFPKETSALQTDSVLTTISGKTSQISFKDMVEQVEFSGLNTASKTLVGGVNEASKNFSRFFNICDATDWIKEKKRENADYSITTYNCCVSCGMFYITCYIKTISVTSGWRMLLSGLPPATTELKQLHQNPNLASPLITLLRPSGTLEVCYGVANSDIMCTIQYPIRPDYLFSFLNELEEFNASVQ